MKDMKKFLPLLLLILVFEGVSATIGLLTAPSGDVWYESLAKAPLNPPDWIFGVVWPSLYFMIAIAVWMVWQQREQNTARIALALFAVHMIFNWSWNFVFFEFQMIGEAFILLLVILIMVAALTRLFYQVKKPAALLMFPYLCWASFATYLSGYIWLMN